MNNTIFSVTNRKLPQLTYSSNNIKTSSFTSQLSISTKHLNTIEYVENPESTSYISKSTNSLNYMNLLLSPNPTVSTNPIVTNGSVFTGEIIMNGVAIFCISNFLSGVNMISSLGPDNNIYPNQSLGTFALTQNFPPQTMEETQALNTFNFSLTPTTGNTITSYKDLNVTIVGEYIQYPYATYTVTCDPNFYFMISPSYNGIANLYSTVKSDIGKLQKLTINSVSPTKYYIYWPSQTFTISTLGSGNYTYDYKYFIFNPANYSPPSGSTGPVFSSNFPNNKGLTIYNPIDNNTNIYSNAGTSTTTYNDVYPIVNQSFTVTMDNKNLSASDNFTVFILCTITDTFTNLQSIVPVILYFGPKASQYFNQSFNIIKGLEGVVASLSAVAVIFKVYQRISDLAATESMIVQNLSVEQSLQNGVMTVGDIADYSVFTGNGFQMVPIGTYVETEEEAVAALQASSEVAATLADVESGLEVLGDVALALL